MMILMQGSLHTSTKECLQEDFSLIARQVLHKRKRPLSYVAFAKRTTHGYAFFESVQEEVWGILHKIAKTVHSLHPEYEFSLVADVCSDMANSIDFSPISSEI